MSESTAAQQGVLNPEAIRRLRELDPTGESQLLSRVFQAFETSLNRLLPQLEQARTTADAASVRLVAHTLKSSSATIGAAQLSKVCAEVEAMAQESRLEAAASGIELILAEAQAVRIALRNLTASDPAPGAA
ncbi:MAG: Hpt domain-containing protein [Burkholderiaceae bacterium]|nr:Hpt domain-containing protein [Burkholderiaceae bacterium]